MYSKGYRGFESLFLRHSLKRVAERELQHPRSIVEATGSDEVEGILGTGGATEAQALGAARGYGETGRAEGIVEPPAGSKTRWPTEVAIVGKKPLRGS